MPTMNSAWLVGEPPRHYVFSGRWRDSEKYKYLGSLTCTSFCDDKSHCKDLFIMKNTVFPDIGNMLYWMMTLGKCTRGNKCTHGTFHVFYFERDVWKWGKHITVNFLQVIHRICLKKRYHSKFSGINHSTVYHKKRKNTIMTLFLPYLPHLPLLYIGGLLAGKSLSGKLLELGLSLIRKLKFSQWAA